MGVPFQYRKSTEGVTASYDYVDIAEGTGIVKFYGGGCATISGATIEALSGATLQHRLDRNAFYPAVYIDISDSNYRRDVRYKPYKGTDANYTKVIDLDFDTSNFNLPRTIQGTMVSNIPISSIALPRCEFYIVQVLKKVLSDGTTEETIATTTSNAFDTLNEQLYKDTYCSLLTDVPITTIKKGEKIRITVEVYFKHISGEGTPEIMICFDPQNRAIGATTGYTITQTAGYTQMQFFIPFRIDL